jgi:hypothetical protein
VQELDHLRVTLATRLAPRDTARAIELLWDFIVLPAPTPS